MLTTRICMKTFGPRALRSFCRELRFFNQQTNHAARKHIVQDRSPRPTNAQIAVHCISYQGIDYFERRMNKRVDFKIPNPRINSPLSLFQPKSRCCKALNLPRSGGIAPAHATDALNKNIRLDLKIISQIATSASRANIVFRLQNRPPCMMRKLL